MKDLQQEFEALKKSVLAFEEKIKAVPVKGDYQEYLGLWAKWLTETGEEIDLPFPEAKTAEQHSSNAHHMLIHIVPVERGNWIPNYSDGSWKYEPRFIMDPSGSGFAYSDCDLWDSDAFCGSRLCTPSASECEATAGTQALIQSEFLMKNYSGHPDSKNISVEGPAGSITTKDSQSVVSTEFIQTYHGNGDNVSSVDRPAPTLPTHDSQGLVQPEFFVNYHHSSNIDSLDKPCPTIICKDKLGLIQPQFIFRQFKTACNNSVEDPAGSMTTNPKMNLVSAEFLMRSDFSNKPSSIDEPAKTLTASRHHQYLVNPSWGGNPSSVDLPHPVIVARQDKAPMYLVTTDDGKAGILIYETDSEYTKKIKDFMAIYGIVDIKMRMLKVQELKKIQGFPATYILKGTQTDQKKFIGNSVVPVMTKKWGECIVINLREYNKAA